jgi:parvulin-like peptidyl-prolyl isomerase
MNRLTNTHRIPALFHGFSLFAYFLCGCDLAEREKENVVIVVGSRQITGEELKKEINFISGRLDLSEQDREQVLYQLAEQVIDRYLILEYAKERRVSITENEREEALSDLLQGYTKNAFKNALLREYVDFEQWKDRYAEQLLINKVLLEVARNLAPPNSHEIQRYYEAHYEEFRLPQMLRFRQIVTRSKQEAEDLLKRIQNGEEMGVLARRYSIAPEAERGGEVGWVAREHLDESMERVIFSMSPGEVSQIVETPYGYHIFELLSRRPERVKKLPEVIPEVEARLLHQRRKVFLRNWLKNLRTHFEVTVNQELLNELEL